MEKCIALEWLCRHGIVLFFWKGTSNPSTVGSMRHQLYQASPKAFITATSTTCSAGICSCTFSKQNIHFCQTRSLLSCSKLVADIGICLQLDAQQQHISGAIESKRTRNLIAAIFSLVRSWHCKVLCWQRGSGHRIMHNHTSVMHSHQRWKWLSGKSRERVRKKEVL